MLKIFLVIGVPSSGKSWVCEQLSDLFHYVPNDDYIGEDYGAALIKAAHVAALPVLAEAPFGISELKERLEAEEIEVVPVFIIEEDDILAERYEAREHREIPKGHLSRQRTYVTRAEEYGAFSGTSEEVLEHLRTLTPGSRRDR